MKPHSALQPLLLFLLLLTLLPPSAWAGLRFRDASDSAEELSALRAERSSSSGQPEAQQQKQEEKKQEQEEKKEEQQQKQEEKKQQQQQTQADAAEPGKIRASAEVQDILEHHSEQLGEAVLDLQKGLTSLDKELEEVNVSLVSFRYLSASLNETAEETSAEVNATGRLEASGAADEARAESSVTAGLVQAAKAQKVVTRYMGLMRNTSMLGSIVEKNISAMKGTLKTLREAEWKMADEPVPVLANRLLRKMSTRLVAEVPKELARHAEESVQRLHQDNL